MLAFDVLFEMHKGFQNGVLGANSTLCRRLLVGLGGLCGETAKLGRVPLVLRDRGRGALELGTCFGNVLFPVLDVVGIEVVDTVDTACVSKATYLTCSSPRGRGGTGGSALRRRGSSWNPAARCGYRQRTTAWRWAGTWAWEAWARRAVPAAQYSRRAPSWPSDHRYCVRSLGEPGYARCWWGTVCSARGARRPAVAILRAMLCMVRRVPGTAGGAVLPPA